MSYYDVNLTLISKFIDEKSCTLHIHVIYLPGHFSEVHAIHYSTLLKQLIWITWTSLSTVRESLLNFHCGWTVFCFMYDPKCCTTFPWCTINAPVAFAWCTMNAPAVFAWCTNHFVHEVEFLYMGWNGVHPLWFYHSPPGPEQFLVCGLLCRLQEYHMITGVQKKK